MEQPIFTSSESFLLRAPISPRTAADSRPDADETDSPTMAGLWDDPVFKEAVLVSSPALAHRAEEIAAGAPTAPKALRKAVRALTRYRLRSTSRPTPFGLMAGVAAGSFSDSPSVRMGSALRKRVQPDQEWLDTVLAHRGRVKGLRHLSHAHVLVNNLCHVRNGRVVLPVVAAADRAIRRTIRKTAVVEAVLSLACRPVPVGEVHDRLRVVFPHARDEQVWGVLERLAELDVLLTDRRPGPGEKDPFAHVLSMDPSWEDGHRYRKLFTAYDAQPVGGGYRDLSALQAGTGSTGAACVDLALDAEVRLPWNVAREVERAASALWRLSTPDHPHPRALRAYHAEFLERYSAGESVQVTRLLDPDCGLGAPAGYRWPPGHREVPPAPRDDPARAGLLTRLITQAAATGQRRVELTDDMVAALAYREGHTPRSAELFVSINAMDLSAIERGDFELAVSPAVASDQAGAAWGRFTHLLGTVDTLADLTLSADPGGDRAMPVHLMYTTPDRRGANIAFVPPVSDRYLAVGLYDDPDAGGGLRIENVLVSADEQHFHLYDRASGREILPFVPHLLDQESAPNIARFLREAPTLGRRALSGWSWAPLHRAPFLPAVQYGRVLLSPAVWRLTATELGQGDWQDEFEGWCKQWNVPERVRLVQGDQYVPLNLAAPGHRRMLRDEVAKKTVAVLQEDRVEEGAGWLPGPTGVHEAEIVVTVYPTRPVPERSRAVAPPRDDANPLHHSPGGSWVSAYLYGSLEGQHEMLAERLAPWVDDLGDLTDGWFFLRYTEEGTGRPHIRLRLHGDPGTLHRRVLPAFHDFSHGLAADGLIHDVALRTYRPEAERYGGVRLISEAESFFCADSRVVLDRLSHGADDPLDVAADVVSLVWHFHRGTASGAEEISRNLQTWIIRNFSKDHQLHKEFKRRQHEALSRISLVGTHSESTDIESSWSARLADYATSVHHAARAEHWVNPSHILDSLIHMHCNRRLKSPDTEGVVRALARGVVETHVNRRRSEGA